MAGLWSRTKAAGSAALTAFRDPRAVDLMKGGMYEERYFGRSVPENPFERYVMEDLYYDALVYKQLLTMMIQVDREQGFGNIKSLENPAIQAVDFHVMHLFPGRIERALPLQIEGSQSDNLTAACNQILTWSNMGRRKRVLSEWLAKYGDVFLKPSRSEDGARVYFQIRKPSEVTYFEEDDRGNVVYCRLDVEITDRRETNTSNKKTWHTEEWSEADDYRRVWVHEKGERPKLSELGEPEETTISSMGIDFVPLVRAPFADSGTERSWGVFDKHVEPFDELNRQATKIRDRYYRWEKPDIVVERNESGQGAVDLRRLENQGDTVGDERTEPEIDELDEEGFWNMPSNASVKSMVPDLNWEAGMSQIEDTRAAIENNLAELRFFRGHDTGDPSAAAMRQHIAPAISRAAEARGNAEDAIVKAFKMCLTIGALSGTFVMDGPQGIGSFDRGDFNGIGFAEREIVPETPTERSTRESAEAQVLEVYARNGLLDMFLESKGYSSEDAKKIAERVQQTGARQSIGSVVNS